jgi:hypothetical protein
MNTLSYEFTLKSNWMERPYFPLQDKNKENTDPNSEEHIKDNHKDNHVAVMCCPMLLDFMSHHSGGIFLVAGTRGIGKTTLVRHTVEQWQKDSTKNLPHNLVYFADAADLGLYEAVATEHLERLLITGLLRILQEAVIPIEQRAGLWNNTETIDKHPHLSFHRDLVALVLAATAANLEKKTHHSGAHEEGIEGAGSLSAKIPAFFSNLINFGVEGKVKSAREWSDGRSMQLVWHNSTDALRAELRALFYRHKTEQWPLLVIDEWDRFHECPPKDTAYPTGAHIHCLEEILFVLSRLKSLLADYPAPIIIIGGEKLFSAVRHLEHKHSSYFNIFNQKCFLSPLPTWTQKKKDKLNPVLPYLDKIIETKTSTDIRRRLANYLLFEIGLNPHALKIFLGNYAYRREEKIHLHIPRTRNTILKEFLGETLQQQWSAWEEKFSGILPADPYRRWCWFRYLRSRLLRYWECGISYKENIFCVPYIRSINSDDDLEKCIDFISYLDKHELCHTQEKQAKDKSTQSDSDHTHHLIPHQWYFDLSLWKTFHELIATTYDLKLDDPMGKIEEDIVENKLVWDAWKEKKIILEIPPDLSPSMRKYDLNVLYEKEELRICASISKRSRSKSCNTLILNVY